MLSQNINLTTNKKPVTPTVHMVQGDSGRKLVCTVYDYTSASSGALAVELPSGTVYSSAGTISSATDHITFSVDITSDMLAEKGLVKGTVKLYDASSKLISSHMLYIDVEESAGLNKPITPNNDKVYVVINGQSVELAKQPQVDTLQTDVTNLKEELSEFEEGYRCEILPLSPSFTKGGYYSAGTEGSIVPNQGFYYTDKIAVTNERRIKFKGTLNNNLANIVLFSSNRVIAVALGTNSGWETGEVDILVPYGCTHYALSYYTLGDHIFTYERNDEINTDTNLLALSSVTKQYMSGNGASVYVNNNYFNVSIKVKTSLPRVYYKLPVLNNLGMICAFDENGRNIKNTYVQADGGYEAGEIVHGYFDLPSNTNYIAFSFINKNYVTGLDLSKCYVKLSNDNALQGKKWLAIGDSITHGETTSQTHSYVDIINGTVDAIKEGHSGYTMGALYDLRSNFVDKADIVTVFAGTNNFNNSTAIGNIDSMDRNNFYGITNLFMKWLQEKYPLSPIVFFTPLHRDCTVQGNVPGETNPAGIHLSEYADAIIKAGRKNGVIVVDLYGQSGFGLYNIQQLTNDGLHPNDNGQQMLSSIILDTIKAHLNGGRFDYRKAN